MKAVFLMLFIAALTFSCSKWGKDKDCTVYTYYSEDYRDTDNEYLGVHSSNLDELYFHFFQDEDKSDGYKFVGEVNGDYVYHEGTYSKTGNTVLFTPDNNSHPSFDGEWSADGKTLTINYPGIDETRIPVTFIAKEPWDHCKKGK